MDSPAMKAGIQSGDVIVGMKGEEITSFVDYHAALLSCEPDTTVTVTVMRQGQEEYQEMEIEVLLQEQGAEDSERLLMQGCRFRFCVALSTE
mgnify:CR=1 FL=1